MAPHHHLWQGLAGYPTEVIRPSESGRAFRVVRPRFVPQPERGDLHTRHVYLEGRRVARMSGHKRLVLWASIGHAKTQTMIARILWELGNNPRMRILVVMNSAAQAAKTLRAIKNYIEGDGPGSRMVHTIFPWLRRGDKWDEYQITVQSVGGQQSARDFAIQCVGRGTKILGARVDLIIVDDILDQETTYKQAARDKIWDWFTTNVLSRIAGNPHARVWLVGTAWHRDDLMYRFRKKIGAACGAYSFPIYNRAGIKLWPERFTDEYIAEWKQLAGPIEFARMCLCQPVSDAATYFSLDWFLECQRRAIGTDPFIHFDREHAMRMYCGVDLGVARHDGADLTSLFITGVERISKYRWPLRAMSGRWAGTEIIGRMCDVHDAYRPRFTVETNAAQEYLRQIGVALGRKIDEPDSMRRVLDVRSMFTTRPAKLDREYGIARMGVEMANHNWRIWTKPDASRPDTGLLDPAFELDEWRSECLAYTPQDHTGDRLMASWLCWLGIIADERQSAGRRAIVGFGRN